MSESGVNWTDIFTHELWHHHFNNRVVMAQITFQHNFTIMKFKFVDDQQCYQFQRDGMWLSEHDLKELILILQKLPIKHLWVKISDLTFNPKSFSNLLLKLLAPLVDKLLSLYLDLSGCSSQYMNWNTFFQNCQTFPHLVVLGIQQDEDTRQRLHQHSGIDCSIACLPPADRMPNLRYVVLRMDIQDSQIQYWPNITVPDAYSAKVLSVSDKDERQCVLDSSSECRGYLDMTRFPWHSLGIRKDPKYSLKKWSVLPIFALPRVNKTLWRSQQCIKCGLLAPP